MAKDGAFVRTPEAEEDVLQYIENKVPLALERSVAAHRFLNKICFNEGYLSGPKVCRSNLETLCMYKKSSFSYQSPFLLLFTFEDRRVRMCFVHTVDFTGEYFKSGH